MPHAIFKAQTAHSRASADSEGPLSPLTSRNSYPITKRSKHVIIKVNIATIAGTRGLAGTIPASVAPAAAEANAQKTRTKVYTNLTRTVRICMKYQQCTGLVHWFCTLSPHQEQEAPPLRTCSRVGGLQLRHCKKKCWNHQAFCSYLLECTIVDKWFVFLCVLQSRIFSPRDWKSKGTFQSLST